MRRDFTLALVIGLAAATSAGQAQDIRYNSFMPPKAVESVHAEEFFKDVDQATNGELQGQVFVGGQMLGGQATLGGIRDGVVDGGFIVPTLNSSQIPHVAMLPELLPFADDFWAATGATNETVMLNCPECVEDLAEHNAVWLGGHAASPWYMMCKQPITSFDDLSGKKIRVTGGFATRMIDALGGVGVALPASEVGPALQQGQVDCAVGNLAWLTTLGLIDSVRGIIDQPFGSYHGLGQFIFNKDSVARLDPAEREAMLNLIPKRIALITKAYADQEAEARAAAEAAGITFWQPDEQFNSTMETFREGELEAVAADIIALGGAQNAAQIVQDHIDTLQKWKALAAEAKGDVDAFAAILDREVFSKVER